MEGCRNLIQSIEALDPLHRSLIIEGFCQAAVATFKATSKDALELIKLGETHAVIGVKILEILGNIPPFEELIDLARRVQDNSQIFTIAFKTYPQMFLHGVVENSYEYGIDTQQCILNIVENDQQHSGISLESLKIAIGRLSKSSEQKIELSMSIHHRTAKVLLQNNPTIVEAYVTSICPENVEILSEILIHYREILPVSFFSAVIMDKLQLELLNVDVNIRKKAMVIIKHALLLMGANSEQWKLFWDIYESLENYNKALVAALWKRVYVLFDWDMSKIRLLFSRAKGHENLTVRRFIAKNYMKQVGIDNEFTVTTFIEYLSDPGLYSDSVDLIGRSRFGELITNFFVKFINNSKSKAHFSVLLIKEALEKIEFQVGFRYFLEVIDKIFEDSYLDAEILEKAYICTTRQMSQLTPFHRHTAALTLKRFVESPTDNFLIPRIRLSSKLPFSCTLQSNLQEASALIEECITLIVNSQPKPLTPEEFGILFSSCFSKDTIKLLLPLFQVIHSIYRNAYLKPEQIKSWIDPLCFILKRLNKNSNETLRFHLASMLDEIFAYSLSATEPDLVNLLGKAMYHSLRSLGAGHLVWTLSKLSTLKDLISRPSPSTIYPTLKYLHKLLKFGSSLDQTEFQAVNREIANLIARFNERQECSRDMFQLVTPLKWKILCIVAATSPQEIPRQAAEILENSSMSMIESVLQILGKGFIRSAREADIEEVCYKAWDFVLETKNDAPLSIVVKFMRLAFNDTTVSMDFCPVLFAKVLALGQDRWGIVRALLYECVPIWIKNPQTITNFLDSIYQLTIYEEPRAEDTDFLIPCMFALINTPKPHIRGDPSTLRSQYIRILILHVVERVAENHSFTQKLVEKCYNGLYDSCQDRGEFPNSLVYKRKVRLGQLLCALCPWVRDFADEETSRKLVEKLVELLKIPYVHSARQYIERFLVITMLKWPFYTDFIELDYDLRPQLAGSYLLVMGSVMVFTENEQVRMKIFSGLLPFMISNTAHIRRIAHFVMFKLIRTYPEYRLKSSVFEFLIHNKECAKMMRRLEDVILSFESFRSCSLGFILTGYFSEFDEILHPSIVAEIEEKTKNLLDTSYEVNFFDVWKKQAEGISMDYKSLPNFQRKVEDTPALIELHSSKGVQQRHELIIVASLVDKVPNLAGLTRTSEVFNLQMITVAYKNILNDNEFKSMAVTADKWVPIMEVPKDDIEKFLKLYRHNKYQIIGLEQTANSVSIEKFNFVSKTVLVLGNEKDGIPGELLPLLDACVEIPQFGLIRSLNVHVSGSICIWEYIKQLYMKI